MPFVNLTAPSLHYFLAPDNLLLADSVDIDVVLMQGVASHPVPCTFARLFAIVSSCRRSPPESNFGLLDPRPFPFLKRRARLTKFDRQPSRLE